MIALTAFTSMSTNGGQDGSGAGVAYLSVVGRYLMRKAVMDNAEPRSERTLLAHGVRT